LKVDVPPQWEIEMVASIKALCFSDPLSFQAAISTADLQLLPTARGSFGQN
jgi:hypothetical protein